MISENDANFQQEDSDSGDDLMAISAQAIQGTNSGKTIKLACNILQHKAILFVDSGSSHNFITQLASHIPHWKPLEKPMQVKVANGSILTCTHEVVNCKWLVQGVQFQTTFKILPLKCYDAILGIDWLEQHSHMEVQWLDKWLSFHHSGAQVKLQGITDTTETPLPISGDQLHDMIKQDEAWCVVQLYAIESANSVSELTPEMRRLLNSLICLRNLLEIHLSDASTISYPCGQEHNRSDSDPIAIHLLRRMK